MTRVHTTYQGYKTDTSSHDISLTLPSPGVLQYQPFLKTKFHFWQPQSTEEQHIHAGKSHLTGYSKASPRVPCQKRVQYLWPAEQRLFWLYIRVCVAKTRTMFSWSQDMRTSEWRVKTNCGHILNLCDMIRGEAVTHWRLKPIFLFHFRGDQSPIATSKSHTVKGQSSILPWEPDQVHIYMKANCSVAFNYHINSIVAVALAYPFS